MSLAVGLDLEDLSELLTKPAAPIDWLLEGRLVAGSVSMFASKPKVGKSTTVRWLTLCVARGEPFLGWETKQGEVIYLNLEERKEDLVEAFRAMGATEADPIKISCKGDVSSLISTLRHRKPVLLIVDPLFRLISVKDEKAYAEVYAQMGPLIDVARETGTHILCLHHSPKQAREDAVDAPLGSTALGGAVSTLFELHRNPNTGMRTIRSTQRVGDDLPKMILHFDSHTGEVSLLGTRQEVDITNLKPFMLAALGQAEMTEDEIFGGVQHGKTGSKRRALRELCAEGMVERSGLGRKGKPYMYRNARSHVPRCVPESRNDNPISPTCLTPEIVVPRTSFSNGNEETSISVSEQTQSNSAKMLVPAKLKDQRTKEALTPESRAALDLFSEADEVTI
jgi:hypothetical protein